MNHQCGWTNSHSAGKRDPQNGEINQLPNFVSKYIFHFRSNEIINMAAKLKSFAMKLNWQLFVRIQ